MAGVRGPASALRLERLDVLQLAVGPRAGQKLFTLQTLPAKELADDQQGDRRGAAKLRAAVTPAHRGMGAPKLQVPAAGTDKPATPRHVAMNWARRLKRVFGVEIR